MKFRHYKGGIYEYITTARHSETGEDLVIYGGAGEGATGIWARPAAMFHGTLKDGRRRFEPIEEQPLPAFMPKTDLPVSSSFSDKVSDCMHDNCPECGGSGQKHNGLGPCVHMMSCRCPKCSAYC